MTQIEMQTLKWNDKILHVIQIRRVILKINIMIKPELFLLGFMDVELEKNYCMGKYFIASP